MELPTAIRPSPFAEFASAVQTELAWDRARAIDAAKIGVACVIGFLIANWGQFDHPYWILVTIFMVGQSSYGSVVEKVVMRALATILGMGLGVCFTRWFPQDHFILAACFAVLVFGSAIGSRGSWHPQAFVMSCVYSGGIASLALSDPFSLPSFFYSRCVDIGIGSVLVLVLFRYVAPRFAAHQLVEGFASFCDRAGEVIEERKVSSAGKAAASVASMTANFQQGTLEGEALPFGPETWTELLAIAERVEARLVILANERPFGGSSRLEELFAESIGKWEKELGEKMRSIAAAIRAGSPPAPIVGSDGREAFHAVIASIRTGPGLPEVSSEQLLQFETRADQLSRLTDDIASISLVLPKENMKPPLLRIPAWKKIFPINAATLLHGLRVCLSIAVVIWLGLIFQWSQMVSVVFTAGLIVQATHGGSIRKAVLRLTGCLIGGVLSILTAVYIFPSVSSWWEFAPILFLVLGFSGYVALGSARFNYAGLQIGLAYVIVLLQTFQPATNLTPIWERIGSILIGGVVALAITRYFFPELAVKTVRSALLGAIDVVREMIRTEVDIHDPRTATQVRQRLEAMREKLRQLNTAVLEARSETFSGVLRSPELMKFARALHDLAYSLVSLSHESVPEELLSPLHDGLTSVASALDAALARIRQALDEGVPCPEEVKIGEAIRELDGCLDAVRKAKLTRQFDANTSIAFFSWVEQLRTVARAVAAIAKSMPRMRLAELVD